jgi:hypothetical protein
LLGLGRQGRSQIVVLAGIRLQIIEFQSSILEELD